MPNKAVHACVSSSPHPQCIVVPGPVTNLVTDYTTQLSQEVTMFVNCLSEIDSALSQVNVLMSEVNSKLELCSAESKKLILSRLSNILSEMMWAVSLSADESSDTESNVSSYSADVESLAWDSSEDFYYKLYYEEEEDEDYMEERSLEIDDHGPIDISEDSSADKEAVHEEDEDNVAAEDSRKVVRIVRKIPASPGWIAPKLIPAFETDSESDVEEGVETVPPPEDTSAAKFVTEMSAKIGNLAPGGSYKVVRPLKYKIDLTNVNERFLQNIPKPQLYPILGVSQDPKFYQKDGQNKILTTTTNTGTQNPATCVTHMEQCTDIQPISGLFQSLMIPSMDTCGRITSGLSRPRWTMVFPPPEDPGLRHGGEAGLLVDGGLGGATHQHKPAPRYVHYVDRCLVLLHYL